MKGHVPKLRKHSEEITINQLYKKLNKLKGQQEIKKEKQKILNKLDNILNPTTKTRKSNYLSKFDDDLFKQKIQV